MSEDRLLTVPEVAARIRCSPESVRRWARQGRLKSVKLGGDRLGFRFLESAVEQFIATGGKPAGDGKLPAS